MLKKDKYFYITVVLIIMAGYVIYAQVFRLSSYQDTQVAMDTIIDITAYGSHSKQAVKEALEMYRHIDTLTNRYNPSSQVSLINSNAGVRAVRIDSELFEILKQGKELSEQSEGAFDITVGSLTDLWGIGKKGEYIPSAGEIERRLPFISYQYLQLDETTQNVYLVKQGASLDLGGIAKGYATDKAIEVLKKHNIKSAMINAGGNIRVIGTRPDGNPWAIGIQHPRDSQAIIARLPLIGYDSLQTSGDYQRFITVDNKRYSHILDPRTGRPSEKVTSVTIINNNSIIGDYLSTAVFVLGQEQGLILLEKYPDTQAVIYTSDGKLYWTPGLNSILTEMK